MLLGACLLVSACSGGPVQSLEPAFNAGEPSVSVNEPERDVLIESGVLSSRNGCRFSYARYRSRKGHPGGLAVLGHGFLRSQERMAALAKDLARNGVTAVTLDFCNEHPWSGRHFRNGLDMIRLADAQRARRVVYVGFSAGGLAALVAGREDPRAVGVVALDLVDADRLGVLLASGLKRPLIGLIGEPSSCNAFNNALPVYASGRSASVKRFRGADHCDFEPETDWLCRLLCDRGADSAPERRRRIREAAVDAVMGLLSGARESGGVERPST